MLETAPENIPNKYSAIYIKTTKIDENKFRTPNKYDRVSAEHSIVSSSPNIASKNHSQSQIMSVTKKYND